MISSSGELQMDGFCLVIVAPNGVQATKNKVDHNLGSVYQQSGGGGGGRICCQRPYTLWFIHSISSSCVPQRTNIRQGGPHFSWSKCIFLNKLAAQPSGCVASHLTAGQGKWHSQKTLFTVVIVNNQWLFTVPIVNYLWLFTVPIVRETIWIGGNGLNTGHCTVLHVTALNCTRHYKYQKIYVWIVWNQKLYPATMALSLSHTSLIP